MVFRTLAFRAADSHSAPSKLPRQATARCGLAARPLVWLSPSSPPPFVSLRLFTQRICPSEHTRVDDCCSGIRFGRLCRNRAAVLVVLITFGAVCHARRTHQEACQAELAKCQALLGAVGAGTGTPSSASEGALIAFWPATDWHSMHRLHAHRCHGRCACARGKPVPCRVTCARRQEQERRAAAGRRPAASRVERYQLRSEAAGVSSARQCKQQCDQPDHPG